MTTNYMDNKPVIMSNKTGEKFAKEVAENIDAENIDLHVEKFPDREMDIQVSETIRGRDVFFFCPFYPNPLERYTETDLVNSAMCHASAVRITDVSTYLGFMKKDWKDRPRVPISIREVAMMMEKYADRVLTMDMHSRQVQGMFRIPLDHLTGLHLFAKHIREHYDMDKSVIVSPDVGGAKRVEGLANELNLPMGLIYKTRPEPGEAKARFFIGDVDGKDAFLLDDQAVTLGTLTSGAQMLKKYGAERVFGYCTHGVFAEKEGVNAESKLENSALDKLYITDTIPRPEEFFKDNEKIGLVSCVNLFSEAVKRTHNNESISELFDYPENYEQS